MRFSKIVCACAVILGLFQSPTAAKNPEYSQGEVIYHQDFSQVSDFSLTGITIGTLSSENASLSCTDDMFRIETYDDKRVYAILPPSDWTENFTIEFDFCFRNTSNPNGYLQVMLTSTGLEPSNISKLIFRAKGTIDDFEEPSDELAEHIRNGEQINVKIPVEKGVVKALFLSSGELMEKLDRASLLLIGPGNRGFSVRNAHVDISEIYIVNGTEYSEKIGYYAEHSYVKDCSKETEPCTPDIPVLPECPENSPGLLPPCNGETAPETWDCVTFFSASAAVTAIISIKRLKKTKSN